MRRHLIRAVVAAAAAGGLAGCGTATSTPSSAPAALQASPTPFDAKLHGPCGELTGAPRYRHVIWIWMGAQPRSAVLGDPTDAPDEVSLAATCGTAAAFSSVATSELANSIAATSGATQGITDEADPPLHPLTVDNLFRQVRSAGAVEHSYQESMPENCQLTATSLYDPADNPATYYVGDGDRAACQRDDEPMLSFFADLANDDLPSFSLLTPNLCDDTTTCSVHDGDNWLGSLIPRLLNSPAYRARDTAIFVIWGGDGPAPSLVISPSTRPGTDPATAFNDYSVLRTTEQLLGLPLLGQAAGAPSMLGPFNL